MGGGSDTVYRNDVRGCMHAYARLPMEATNVWLFVATNSSQVRYRVVTASEDDQPTTK